MLIPPDKISSSNLLIDVRSPSEFKKGHIVNAINIPLFSDQERHEIGICYKYHGQSAALELGLQMVKPKLKDWINQANEAANSREVTVYCWRGGLRSKAMSWLLSQGGFKVDRLSGGYKAWRNYALTVMRTPRRFIAISGFTGVGKTEILQELSQQGEQILDLEAIANHQGSAFAHETLQPSTEHFENLVAKTLLSMNPNQIIWIEDESRSIGKVYLDHQFFTQISNAPVILVTRPFEERVSHLCASYGKEPKKLLIEGFNKIRKRLGGQYADAAIKYVEIDNLAAAARIALSYYDKAYLNSMKRTERNPNLVISIRNKSFSEIATELIKWKTETISKHRSLQA